MNVIISKAGKAEYKPMVKTGRQNMCEYQKHPEKEPILKMLLDRLNQFGQMDFSCPVKPVNITWSAKCFKRSDICVCVCYVFRVNSGWKDSSSKVHHCHHMHHLAITRSNSQSPKKKRITYWFSKWFGSLPLLWNRNGWRKQINT